MKRDLPDALKNEDFRFYLLAKNTKNKPIEKDYKKTNNHMFFEPKLRNHLLKGGNVGVVTGYGNLIVVDFDDADYQKEKAKLLPKTFTVTSAGKGLQHHYFILEGEMISKIGSDACEKCKVPAYLSQDTKREKGEVWRFCSGCKKWILPTRMYDIQAGRECVTCPPSSIDGRFYNVIEDRPIATITPEALSKAFGTLSFKEPTKRNYETKHLPEEVKASIKALESMGLKQTAKNSFNCPYHSSHSQGCLRVFPSGSIYCFHCLKQYWSGDHLKRKWEKEHPEVLI